MTFRVPRILIHTVLGLVIVGILALNAVFYYRIRHTDDIAGDNGAADGIDGAVPAVIALTIISTPDCKECFDMNIFADALEQGGQVEISDKEELPYQSEAGARLVAQYGIKKLPTILVRGDVDKIFDMPSFTQNLGTVTSDGALLVTNVPAPYLDLASGAIKGRFVVTYISDASCADCYDVALHQQAFSALQMAPAEEYFLDRKDSEAAALIKQYQVETLPTIILRGELEEYSQFAQVWATVGTVEADGAYVFRQGQKSMGTYYDLQQGVMVSPDPETPAEF